MANFHLFEFSNYTNMYVHILHIKQQTNKKSDGFMIHEMWEK
jgi:hypothetical protein